MQRALTAASLCHPPYTRLVRKDGTESFCQLYPLGWGYSLRDHSAHLSWNGIRGSQWSRVCAYPFEKGGGKGRSRIRRRLVMELLLLRKLMQGLIQQDTVPNFKHGNSPIGRLWGLNEP
ncbi:protein phosphatase 1 regulatory subunit 17 [Platysternon megacephalum]|uniref:Protein phosphatase 1 regulatory subunit 17 n=1 Tax=Platysternon megacephalum TaxID=55544 RepID=A0A4D9EIE9_9SAUR|nr:protein phosphatase 1 regulatory subunit 17 [Platysternon megacephalum]